MSANATSTGPSKAGHGEDELLPIQFGRFAGVTVVAGRLSDPAPKRVVEGAHLGVAETVSDLGDAETWVFEQVQRQCLSDLVEQIRVVQTPGGEASLEGPHRPSQALCQALHTVVALNDELRDVAPQARELIALSIEAGELQVAIVPHESLHRRVGGLHRPFEHCGIEADASPGVTAPDLRAQQA